MPRSEEIQSTEGIQRSMVRSKSGHRPKSSLFTSSAKKTGIITAAKPPFVKSFLGLAFSRNEEGSKYAWTEY